MRSINNLILFEPEESCNIPDHFVLKMPALLKTLPDFWIRGLDVCALAWSITCCLSTPFSKAGEPYECECEYVGAEEYARLCRGHLEDETAPSL